MCMCEAPEVSFAPGSMGFVRIIAPIHVMFKYYMFSRNAIFEKVPFSMISAGKNMTKQFVKLFYALCCGLSLTIGLWVEFCFLLIAMWP